MNNSSQPFFYYRIDETPAVPRTSVQTHANVQTDTPTGGALATFERLYESIDHRLCMFETKEGHLACVQAARLI